MITTVIAAMFVIAIACSAKDASPPNKGFFNDATASFLAVTVSHGTEALIIEGDGGRSYSEAGPLGIGGDHWPYHRTRTRHNRLGGAVLIATGLSDTKALKQIGYSGSTTTVTQWRGSHADFDTL